MSQFALKLVAPPDAEPADRADADRRSEAASRGVWLSIDEASERSKQSLGHLKRQCAKLWSPRGLARKTRSESGQEVWVVSELADPRFAGVKFPEQMSSEFRLADLPDKLQAIVLQREQIVLDWLKDCAAGFRLNLKKTAITATFVANAPIRFGLTLNTATLYRWHAAYRRLGRAGLVDGRREKDEDGQQAHEDFRAYFLQLFLHPNRRSVTLCYDHARIKAQESGWTFPQCDRTCRRWVAALDPRLVTLKREGEKASQDKHVPFVQRDYSELASNEIWCGDHHQFDVIVNFGTPEKPRHARPWVTAWEDLRSRKIVGYTLTANGGNTDTILSAFVMGADTHGLPWRVYIDNGADYDARTLQGETKGQRQKRRGKGTGLDLDPVRTSAVFPRFHVEVTHALPYNAQGKPIERAFRTVCGRFSKLFDTYCGSNPQDKPHGLQDRVNRGMAPLFEDFAKQFAEWLEADYHGRLHLGDSMNAKPAEVFEQCLAKKRTTPSREELILGCMPRVERTVQQNGISHNGLFYGGRQEAILSRIGQKVWIAIDNADRTRLMVLDHNDGRFIAAAMLNVKPGFAIDSQDVRAANADRQRTKKVIREMQDRRPRVAADMQETLGILAARAARDRAPVSNEPPLPIVPARVIIDAQRAQIRAAINGERMKLAAGAEEFNENAGSTAGTEAGAISFAQLMANRALPEEQDQ